MWLCDVNMILSKYREQGIRRLCFHREFLSFVGILLF